METQTGCPKNDGMEHHISEDGDCHWCGYRPAKPEQWWTPEKIRYILYTATNMLNDFGVSRGDQAILWGEVKQWLESKRTPRSPKQAALHYLSLLSARILRDTQIY